MSKENKVVTYTLAHVDIQRPRFPEEVMNPVESRDSCVQNHNKCSKVLRRNVMNIPSTPRLSSIYFVDVTLIPSDPTVTKRDKKSYPV